MVDKEDLELVQIAMPAFELHDVAAGEDHVVTVLDVTWRRPNGETFESKAVQVFHVEWWEGPGVMVHPGGAGRSRRVPRKRVRLAFATSGGSRGVCANSSQEA